MSANSITQFNRHLDQLLGIIPGQPSAFNPPLRTAGILMEMDLDSDSVPRPALRARWVSRTRASSPDRAARRRFTARSAWIVALILAIILLIAFRQPVLAAVSRLFGYIYVQDEGFLPADSTLVPEQPVLQEHDGRSLAVTQGVATPNETILWLEFSDTARPVDGAWLETDSGARLEVSHWQYSPNATDSRRVTMFFPSLPSDTTETILALPEGWRLPLIWIPASRSNLPDVRVVPYAELTQGPSAPANDLCVEKHRMRLCVLAATTSPENTSVLLEAQSTNPDLLPGDSWQGLVWQTETELVTLRDAQGNILQMNGERAGTLTFAPLPGGEQKVMLTVPALLASVDIPDQSINIDMGDNPQPDTVIPLDVNIQVLGMTVHFGKAAFVGDGVNSLRLTLDAAPAQTVDGITPASLEMGKPERVDDLYGSGMLAGSKDLFVELIRPNGKITGVLTLPIIKATVIVQGPFEFTFTLSDAASQTPTPAMADPNVFSPAPTPTPLPLNSYFYDGQTLQSGDLLYTVLDGDKTDMYTFTPSVDEQPRRIVTLPGSVSQIYLHRDRQGMDYLAGTQARRDGFFYIDHIRLYTVRFAESVPRLLYSFSPNSENTVGTTVEGDWSYDGRYAIFRVAGSAPGSPPWQYLWFDMSCRSSGNCAPHGISLQPNLDLYKAYFAPNDYRILFSGSDDSGTGEPAIFLLDLNSDKTAGQVVNVAAVLPNLPKINAEAAGWMPDGRILSYGNDGKVPPTNMFCFISVQTGKVECSKPISQHLFSYQLSPSGNEIVGVIINHNGPGKGILEIHLFDLQGDVGPALASERTFIMVATSPSDQYIAYVPESGDHGFGEQLKIVDMLSGDTIPVFAAASQWAVSWVGWVR